MLEGIHERVGLGPKGKQPGDSEIMVTRKAKDTRPLNLSNCDAKHVSSMTTSPLCDVACKTVASFQKGGLKGRVFTEHILDLEAKIISYFTFHLPLSGISALDQEAAFPSIARKYVFWILRRMGIHSGVINVLLALYANCIGFLCLAGRLYDPIHQDSGVKQGDPASMVLFILAYDPILRWINAQLSPYNAVLFAMCDDLAIATYNMPATWVILLKIFYIVSKFSGLNLNQPKTQALITDLANLDNIRIQLLSGESGLLDHSFKSVLKYLGIHIGPGSQEIQWQLASAGFREVVNFIRRLNSGLVSSVVLYNILAISKFSYIASFAAPSSETLALERWGQQAITKGPWMAFPPTLLTNLKDLGLPAQITSLEHYSLAARARNGLKTLGNFQNISRLYTDMLEDDECNLCEICSPLRLETCFHFIGHAIQYCRGLGIDTLRASARDNCQAIISREIQDASDSDKVELFQRRMVRFFRSNQHLGHIPSLITLYKKLFNKIKPNLISSHLRVCFNQWAISRRFGKDGVCPFCESGEDSIEHSLTCEAWQLTYHSFFHASGLLFRWTIFFSWEFWIMHNLSTAYICLYMLTSLPCLQLR